MDVKEAKERLDEVIGKQRVIMYKPIQIAEILYRIRLGKLKIDDIRDVERYRNLSKRWRDEVTKELVGQVCTSSQRFQDNLFDDNAVPPSVLEALAVENIKYKGVVEAYIYLRFLEVQNVVSSLHQYISSSSAQTFKLDELLGAFERQKKIRRSVDKAYEIVVYALFDTIVRALKVTVTLEMEDKNIDLIKEFDDFCEKILSLSSAHPKIEIPARLYRTGVANAADRGLDMWSNFGPAIQVKHVDLSLEIAESITEGLICDRIIIVCKQSQKAVIQTVFSQSGFGSKIQSIITESDLGRWYEKALRGRFSKILGNELLSRLKVEFESEFPVTHKFESFFRERHYESIEAEGSPFYVARQRPV